MAAIRRGNFVTFSYTVTGLEADPENLVIPLPATRRTVAYGIFPAQGQHTNLLGMGVLAASKTTSQFVLSLSGASTAGDVFVFIVGDI